LGNLVHLHNYAAIYVNKSYEPSNIMHDAYPTNIQNNLTLDYKTVGTFIFMFQCPVTLHVKFQLVYLWHAFMTQENNISFQKFAVSTLHKLCVGWISGTVSNLDTPTPRSSRRLSLRTYSACSCLRHQQLTRQITSQSARDLPYDPARYFVDK
jgi:hypothetical protein